MERVWTSRLRWRVRGAWEPWTFGAALVAGTVVLHELPVAGSGPGWVPAALLALFFALVAVLAGMLAAPLLRRARPDLPRVVARDYAGSAALVLATAAMVVAGLAHRGALRADRQAFAAQSATVRAWAAHHAPAAYRRRIDDATTMRFGERLYRTCIPGPSARRALCVFVDTTTSPPRLRRDPSPSPNSTFTPSRGPGA